MSPLGWASIQRVKNNKNRQVQWNTAFKGLKQVSVKGGAFKGYKINRNQRMPALFYGAFWAYFQLKKKIIRIDGLGFDSWYTKGKKKLKPVYKQ